MKRLVICCDGTWNTADQEWPTNVTRLALAVAPTGHDGREQRLYYRQGVGTTRWQRVRGGAFGVGLSSNVIDAYRFIVRHYEPGDDLFFFGFSRGAFTARSTAGLVRSAGILRRENVDLVPAAYALYRARNKLPRGIESTLFRRAYSHETRVRFIGVWDTVGALGIPASANPLVGLLNRRWQFHDTQLSSYVDAAFHALAIDEKRGPFRPAIWYQSDSPAAAQQVMEQVWFPGVHSDVGGGYAAHGASDTALMWLADKAREWGLGLRDDAFASEAVEEWLKVLPDPAGRIHESRKGIYRLMRPWARPIGEQKDGHESLAPAALARHALGGYAPANLTSYLARQAQGAPPAPAPPATGEAQVPAARTGADDGTPARPVP